MGIVLAVKKGKEICIAADSLIITGESRKQISENVVNCDKIISVGSSYIGLADHAAWFQVLQDYFQHHDELQLNTSEAIFSSYLRLHQALKEEYHLSANDESDCPFESSQFNSLIVNSHGIFKTYELRSVQEFLQFAAIGSGEEYALGALYALYDKLESASDIAKAALRSVVNVDNDSDLPMTFYNIEAL